MSEEDVFSVADGAQQAQEPSQFKQNQVQLEEVAPVEQQAKNCKLHITNLPTDIAEEVLRNAFIRFGTIREVKVIRKNSQGQPLKDHCYGFVLMAESGSAMKAVNEMKSNTFGWTVSYSKDKVSDGQGPRKASSPSRKKDKEKKSEKKVKKEKSKDKKDGKNTAEKKKKKKSKSKSKSRSRSASPKKKKSKPNNRRRSSSSSSEFVPKHSVLVPVQSGGLDSDKLASMMFMQHEELQHYLKQPPNSSMGQVTHPIHVRELFISGIPLSKSSDDLKKIMNLFGIIEKIDIFPKQQVLYAYVKYKRIESAYKAYEQAGSIAHLLDSSGQVKVYFSDPYRRNQIVGNADDSEKESELLPVLFIGYPSNPNFTIDEVLLRKLAEKYGGEVKNLEHRKSEPQLRTFVLIEFFQVSQARQAKKRFLRVKVQTLGDKKCDVAMLSDLPPSVQNLQARVPQPAYRPFNPMQQQQTMYRPPPFQQQQQQQQQFFPQVPMQNQPFRPPFQPPPQATQPTQNKQTTPQHSNIMSHMLVPPNLQPPPFYGQQQTYQQQAPPQTQTYPTQVYQPTQTQNPIEQPTQAQQPYGYNQQQQQQYYPPFQQTQQPVQQPQQQYQTPANGQQPYNRVPQSPSQGIPQQMGQGIPQQPLSQMTQMNPSIPNQIQTQIPNQIPQMNQQLPQQMQQLTSQIPVPMQQIQQEVRPPQQQQNYYGYQQPQPQQQQQPQQQPPAYQMQQQNSTNDEVFWAGFMVRGKTNRLGIDARILRSQDPRKVLLPNYLNVNFKASIQDAVGKASAANATVMIFTPSDETQYRNFDEQCKYFLEKNRAGVVQLEDTILYILPPGLRECEQLYQASEREMIAIYWPKQ